MEFEPREQDPFGPVTRQLISETEQLTGRTISFVEDARLAPHARASYAASRSDEERDIVLIAPGEGQHLDHLVCHELGHIRHFETVPLAERTLPVVSETTVRQVAAAAAPELRTLTQRGFPPEVTGSLLRSWSSGLVAQLANTPADIEIEHDLWSNRPALRDAQTTSLLSQVRASERLLGPEVRRTTPAAIWRASTAMQFALSSAVLQDIGALGRLAPYRVHPQIARLGLALLDAYTQRAPKALPGFYAVSQDWAEILGLPHLLDLRPLTEVRRQSQS